VRKWIGLNRPAREFILKETRWVEDFNLSIHFDSFPSSSSIWRSKYESTRPDLLARF